MKQKKKEYFIDAFLAKLSVCMRGRERLLFYHHHQHHIQASCIYSQRTGYRNKLFNETQKYLFIFIFNEMEEEEEEEVNKKKFSSSKPHLN